MKKASKHIWLTILGVGVVGAAGVWAYEKYYAATTIAPGNMTVATPSNGMAALALPSGAKSWTAATVVSIAGGTATSPAVPSSPTSHFTASVQKGALVTVTWVDSTGAAQITMVSFN